MGDFSADILAEEENTGRKIIIENQLETTDHDHLGKIITYASGYDAEIIIWIVKDTRQEHIRAIDWLNEHSDKEINFFLVRIELWKIGDSLAAPKFQVISQPNNWAKEIKDAAIHLSLTGTKKLQFEFWNEFKAYGESHTTQLKLRKPSPQHWYDISIGTGEAHLSLTINSKDRQIGCEMYIPDSKELFRSLHERKTEIEEDLKEKPQWMELPDKKASRIKIVTKGDINNRSEWQNYFAWLLQEAEKFHQVFPKYLD